MLATKQTFRCRWAAAAAVFAGSHSYKDQQSPSRASSCCSSAVHCNARVVRAMPAFLQAGDAVV